MLAFKLFLVPTFIALIAICGRLWGASFAGLLAGLPVVAGPVICFIYIENGLAFAQKTAVATIGGIVALSSFCFTYTWLGSRFSWLPALLLSLLVYFAVALLVAVLGVGLNESALLALVIVLLQLYLSPALENHPFIVPASSTEIICRMVFAFVLVFGVTMFAGTLGETYSGILAVFPVAGSTIALFSHRNHSADHAIRSLKSMKQGLLSMLVFFYVIVIASDVVEFLAAVAVATLAALLLQAIIIFVKQTFTSLSRVA